MAIVAAGTWPVPHAVDAESTVLEAIFDDLVLVGLARLALVAAIFYFIASVPALVMGGRWAKSFGTTGIVADDAQRELPAVVADVERVLAGVRLENERLIRERDHLLSLIDAETKPE